MAETISLDELLSAFREAGFSGEPDAPGKTTKELMELWGCSKDRAVAILHQAKAAGMLKTGKRTMERIDGDVYRGTVYSFVFDAKKKGRKR